MSTVPSGGVTQEPAAASADGGWGINAAVPEEQHVQRDTAPTAHGHSSSYYAFFLSLFFLNFLN